MRQSRLVMWCARTLSFLAVMAAAATLLYGQAQISSGDVKGTVIDPAGGAIANVKVVVSDPERAITRETETDAAGEYRVGLLPPGKFRIRLEAAGFATKVLEGVEVRVGDAVVLRTTLEVGSVNTELVVTAEAPVVEYERSQQAATIDWKRLESLPINRRNYLDLALLTPGVTQTNDLVDGTDYRVAQTPQSGLNFGGTNGRGNTFLVDGVENYLNSGGVRLGISQEVVQEFQINRNSFGAEFGGASGGAVSIITKGGTNEVHGDLFGFLRNRAIQARNYFDSEKSAFTRAQYGATLGGPLRKNKTFFFAGFERLDRRETAFVPILWDRSIFGQLTASQQKLVDYFKSDSTLAALGGALQKYLTTNSFPSTLKLFNDNSGNFPFAEDDTRGNLRLDHHFSDKHAFFARGNYSKDKTQNSQFGALIGISRGRLLDLDTHDAMASDTYMISNRWVSETRFNWSDSKLTIRPNDLYGPSIDITGYGMFGRDFLLPSTSYERHFFFSQILDFNSGRHTVKFGAEINPVRDKVIGELFFGGRFAFGEAIPLASLLPKFGQSASAIIGLLNSRGQPALAAAVMQPMTALQSFNLGLPTYYQQGFGDPNWFMWFKRQNFFIQDTFKVAPNFVLNLGVRYEYEIPPENLPVDSNNVAPRIGFAWTPVPNGKTVIRGGWGMYYAAHTAQESNSGGALAGEKIAQVFAPVTGVTGVINPLTKAPVTSADVWAMMLSKGLMGTRTITPADIGALGLQPGLQFPGRVVFGVSPDYVNAYSHQASFEIERAVGSFALSAGYAFNRGAHIGRTRDENLYYAGRTPANQPIFGKINPAMLQYNIFESNANSFYHALTLQATKRFSNHFMTNVHYTFSKTIDEVLDFNSDFEPNDQLNARAERALSSFHQKHRLVASAVLESPLKAGRGQSFASNLFGDFLFSPIVMANSGHPFNLLSGMDNYGDNHPNVHRPFNAGRNIGMGPDFFTIDMRLTRRFPLSRDGQRNVEFTAEGFNLLNRTNFKSINNTVGNIDINTLAHPIVGVRGIPTSPLAFTSAFDPRQFQFGLKINF